MNKRGQIYILIAIIFGFVIYLLATVLNTVNAPKTEDNFIDISNNYDKESAKFLTSLAQEQLSNTNLDIADSFNSFTGKFTSYSKIINPSFGFIYFFDYSTINNNQLIIGNHLDQGILVWFDENNKVYIPGCKSQVPLASGFGDLTSKFSTTLLDALRSCRAILTVAANNNIYNVTYVVGNIKYTSSAIKGVPQIVILSEERNEDLRKVYTNHKFERGENWIAQLVNYCKTTTWTTIDPPVICNCKYRENELNCLINDYCRWDGNKGECVLNE